MGDKKPSDKPVQPQIKPTTGKLYENSVKRPEQQKPQPKQDK